jgi:DNA-binding IclR family transcriptional regulator
MDSRILPPKAQRRPAHSGNDSLPPASQAPLPPQASLVPALQRGILLLEWVAQQPNAASISEAAESLHLPLPSALRMARTLEELGYLERNALTKRYRLTSRMLRMGQPHSGPRSLAECCTESLHAVLTATAETTQLCCLSDSDCVLIDQLPSPHPFKYVVDLGSRTSPHCCAPGKAILAHLPPAQLEALLPKLHLVRHTAKTLTRTDELLAEFSAIRAQGYATDCGEHFDGIHCVAAPLLDARGHAFAAITIAGPASRIPPKNFPSLGRVIAQAAAAAASRFLT